MLRTRSLIVSILLAAATLVLASELARAGKPAPPPPPLPNVRYQLSFISFPHDGEYTEEVRMRSDGQVTAVVGSFYCPFPLRHAFLYCPVLNANEALDLNDWFFGDPGDAIGSVPAGFPTESYLSNAQDINNQMVVVGAIKDAQSGNMRGFAIDLSIWPPVLDLLPTGGCANSAPREINENGDILMYCEVAPGVWQCFLFNPGYYGNPQTRQPRILSSGNPVPLDFSNDLSAATLPIVVSVNERQDLFLNNPTAARNAQIVGRTDGGVPFRYTMGDSDVQFFGFTCADIDGLNDQGSFCGATSILVRKKYDYMPFRHTDSMGISEPGIVAGAAADTGRWATGINNSGDLVTRLQVYRDDWGWVNLNDLVVGDVTRWNTTPLKLWPTISDRIDIGPNGSPAGIIVTGENNSDEVPDAMIIMTPVPAQ